MTYRSISSCEMFLKIHILCLVIIICETAKLGFGNTNNGKSPSEPSSLKSEIMKFKTSECGGSSSEEDNRSNRRRGNHRNKKGSDEDDSDESDENDNKKKKGGKQRNQHGNGKNRGFTSFEGVSSAGRFGMMERRPPPDDMYSRRPGQGPEPFNPWDQNRPNNQFPNRGPNPYPNGQDPYGYQQDQYGNNGGHRYNNKDAGNRWNNRDEDRFNRDDRHHRGDRDDDRYNNRNHRDRFNNRGNRDDRYQTKNGHNNGDDYEDSGRGGNRRRNSNNKRVNNRRNSGEEMEDDGIPSEAGMIKWAQDKIKNDKLKQAGIKEIRKCFGTLASSDGENSCNFSKSLSACLKLGLDEDKD